MSKLWKALGGRKFLVLVIATVLCLLSKLESWHWVILAGVYLGVNVAQDWILKGKG